MILAIENLVWMEPKQVKQNANGDKNDRNLHANMLLKFVSPVVVNVDFELEMMKHDTIILLQRIQPNHFYLSWAKSINVYILSELDSQCILYCVDPIEKTNNKRKFNKQMRNAQQMKWK